MYAPTVSDYMRRLLLDELAALDEIERAGAPPVRHGDRRCVLPWMPLGEFPTPVERIADAPPGLGSLWQKRDDLAGQRYGGNKIRKLEFILGAAAAGGATRLATIGGIGSHHVLATAIYGAERGFEVAAVVFPQPLNDHVREQLLADAAVGLRFYASSSYLTVPLAWIGARRGRRWVEAGGSSVAGVLGYVAAAFELRRQIDAGELPEPDVIYLALGSCGSAAGLWAGLALAGLTKTRLVAVRVVERIVCNEAKTRRLARAALARLDRSAPALPPLVVEHRQFGGAYGRATEAGLAACRWAEPRGLVLEPTYTGKTMAALLADAERGALAQQHVLFWNTFSSRPMAPLLAHAPSVPQLPPALQRYFPRSLDAAGGSHA